MAEATRRGPDGLVHFVGGKYYSMGDAKQRAEENVARWKPSCFLHVNFSTKSWALSLDLVKDPGPPTCLWCIMSRQHEMARR